jgi:proteic killer suppression protein
VAIQSFADTATEKFFNEDKSPHREGWGAVRDIVRRKLDMLHVANQLEDLRSPPNNRLELLRGDLTGYHSIRVNDQWRVVFKWTAQGPSEARVTDYH